MVDISFCMCIRNSGSIINYLPGEWINWEIGIDIYTLLYIKQITKKDLLHSTGNSTQYSVMTCMEKEFLKRVAICIRITESLCCTAEITIAFLIQLYFNKNLKNKNKTNYFPKKLHWFMFLPIMCKQEFGQLLNFSKPLFPYLQDKQNGTYFSDL